MDLSSPELKADRMSVPVISFSSFSSSPPEPCTGQFQPHLAKGILR